MSSRRRRALYANLAAHELRQLLADRQPQARSAVLAHRGSVHLGEGPEQAVPVLRRNPDSGIGDREAQATSCPLLVQRDANGDLPAPRELNRVIRQVQEYLPQPRRIAANGGWDARIQCGIEAQALFCRGRAPGCWSPLRRPPAARNRGPPAPACPPRSSRSPGRRRPAPTAWPEDRARAAWRRCFGSRLVPRSSSVMPITPWSGVRSSWLMLARKVLFARLAASACSRSVSSVTSTNDSMPPVTRPSPVAKQVRVLDDGQGPPVLGPKLALLPMDGLRACGSKRPQACRHGSPASKLQGTPEHVAFCESCDAREFRIDTGDVPVYVDREDGRGGGAEDLLLKLIAPAQGVGVTPGAWRSRSSPGRRRSSTPPPAAGPAPPSAGQSPLAQVRVGRHVRADHPNERPAESRIGA